MARPLLWMFLLWAGCTTVPPPQAPASDAVERTFELAERFYAVGDYVSSTVQCERALRMDPFHGPSRILRHELISLTRANRVSPRGIARNLLVQVDACLDEARHHLFFGDLLRAAKLAILALDEAPLLPPSEIELRVRQARAILEWVEAFRE